MGQDFDPELSQLYFFPVYKLKLKIGYDYILPKSIYIQSLIHPFHQNKYKIHILEHRDLHSNRQPFSFVAAYRDQVPTIFRQFVKTEFCKALKKKEFTPLKSAVKNQ